MIESIQIVNGISRDTDLMIQVGFDDIESDAIWW